MANPTSRLDPSTANQPDISTEPIRKLTLGFWVRLLWLTLVNRHLSRVAALAESHSGAPLIQGAENVPADGNFVLAVNHYLPNTLLRILGAVLASLTSVRADAVDQMLIVAGKSNRKQRSWFKRTWQRCLHGLIWCWRKNVVTIAVNERSLTALREWKRRAKTQPVLVFPEGKSSKEFTGVKKTSGRWLRSLAVPVVPVAVWHQNGQWQVRFGAPVQWRANSAEHDDQLSAAMALLLPAELAPRWHSS